MDAASSSSGGQPSPSASLDSLTPDSDITAICRAYYHISDADTLYADFLARGEALNNRKPSGWSGAWYKLWNRTRERRRDHDIGIARAFREVCQLKLSEPIVDATSSKAAQERAEHMKDLKVSNPEEYARMQKKEAERHKKKRQRQDPAVKERKAARRKAARQSKKTGKLSVAAGDAAPLPTSQPPSSPIPGQSLPPLQVGHALTSPPSSSSGASPTVGAEAALPAAVLYYPPPAPQKTSHPACHGAGDNRRSAAPASEPPSSPAPSSSAHASVIVQEQSIDHDEPSFDEHDYQDAGCVEAAQDGSQSPSRLLDRYYSFSAAIVSPSFDLASLLQHDQPGDLVAHTDSQFSQTHPASSPAHSAGYARPAHSPQLNRAVVDGPGRLFPDVPSLPASATSAKSISTDDDSAVRDTSAAATLSSLSSSKKQLVCRRRDDDGDLVSVNSAEVHENMNAANEEDVPGGNVGARSRRASSSPGVPSSKRSRPPNDDETTENRLPSRPRKRQRVQSSRRKVTYGKVAAPVESMAQFSPKDSPSRRARCSLRPSCSAGSRLAQPHGSNGRNARESSSFARPPVYSSSVRI